MKYLLLTLAIGASVLVVLGLRIALRTYLKFLGKRLVSCPETHQPAAVRVATGKAAFKATLGDGQLRLSECSRWPEKEACGQECLAQIQEHQRPAWYGPSSTGGIRDRSVCIATNRSEKSIGTIILRRYWIPSAKLLNGTRSLLKSCRKFWEHTGPSAGTAMWPKPFGASIPNWWWIGPRPRCA